MPSNDIPPEPSAVSNRTGALLLALSLLWCLYWFIHARGYWEDDAYIHLEFARSIAAGQGFSFNGHVVAGDTAPLWVLLLGAMHAIIPDWLAAGKALTVVGAAVGVAGSYFFARRLATSLVPQAKLFPAAMVLLIVANPYSCYWIFSGMESFAVAGVACFAALAATRERPSTLSFLTACLLAGVAPLMRPEMLFLTALLALPLLALWRRLPASTARFAIFAGGLILLVAPLALWAIYSFHAFGHVLPNTNAAKRAPPNASVVHRLAAVYSLGFPVIFFGLFAGIACLALRPAAVRRSFQNAIAFTQTAGTLPLAGWIFILWPAIATIFYIANHTYVQTRYILVTAPGLTIVILALVANASRRLGRAMYLVALVAALAVSLVIVRPFIHNKALTCRVTDDLAIFIRDRIPPDAPVAVYEIGQITFVSGHPIIDTGGITRPGAIPYLNAPLRVMTRWAQSEGARYYVSALPPEPGSVAVFTGSFPFVGWSYHTSLYSTIGQTSLWELPPLSSTPQLSKRLVATNP